MSEQVEVICGSTAHACRCRLTPGHEGPHECVDLAVCNGSWSGTYMEDDFLVVRWPRAGGVN